MSLLFINHTFANETWSQDLTLLEQYYNSADWQVIHGDVEDCDLIQNNTNVLITWNLNTGCNFYKNLIVLWDYDGNVLSVEWNFYIYWNFDGNSTKIWKWKNIEVGKFKIYWNNDSNAFGCLKSYQFWQKKDYDEHFWRYGCSPSNEKWIFFNIDPLLKISLNSEDILTIKKQSTELDQKLATIIKKLNTNYLEIKKLKAKKQNTASLENNVVVLQKQWIELLNDYFIDIWFYIESISYDLFFFEQVKVETYGKIWIKYIPLSEDKINTIIRGWDLNAINDNLVTLNNSVSSTIEKTSEEINQSSLSSHTTNNTQNQTNNIKKSSSNSSDNNNASSQQNTKKKEQIKKILDVKLKSLDLDTKITLLEKVKTKIEQIISIEKNQNKKNSYMIIFEAIQEILQEIQTEQELDFLFQ